MLAPPQTPQLPAGALGELFRRIGMELGAIPPPAGTVRIERHVSLPLKAASMNDTALKSRSFDKLKTDLQGQLMRAFHRTHYLMPRPIPSVGADGISKAPIWVHARLRFDKPANRDDENYRVLISKAVGDALVGPKLRRVNGKFVDAKRTMIYPPPPARGGAAYRGEWLDDDNARNWLLTFEIDQPLGPPCLSVLLVWDQPVGYATDG